MCSSQWGTISAQIYCQYTVPVILNYLWNYPGLFFQQDGGPGHKSATTLAFMASRGLVPIFWPPFSLDLSPIGNNWNRMKDILQQLDLEVHRNSKRLKAAVLRAWDTITDTEVGEQIRTMHQRCLDVIAAHRMEAKWWKVWIASIAIMPWF